MTTCPEIINTINLFIPLVQTLILIAGAIFAVWQIDGARKAQLLGAVWEIFNKLDSPEIIEAREFLYQHKDLYRALDGGNVEELNKLPPPACKNAQLVGNSFSRVGYAVSQNLIPPELILKGYHVMIGKCWCILEPYIEMERSNRRNKEFQRPSQFLGNMVYEKYISKKQIRQMLDEAPINRPPLKS